MALRDSLGLRQRHVALTMSSSGRAGLRRSHCQAILRPIGFFIVANPWRSIEVRLCRI